MISSRWKIWSNSFKSKVTVPYLEIPHDIIPLFDLITELDIKLPSDILAPTKVTFVVTKYVMLLTVVISQTHYKGSISWE
jgi:hypothetical protein